MKKKVRIGRWIFLLVAVAFLYFIITSDQGLIELYQSRMELKRNRLLLQQRRAQLDSLKREEQKLRSDTSYIEKIAREKLGMARKDETVYKFVEEKK